MKHNERAIDLYKKVGFEIENIDLYYPNFIIKLIQRIKKEKPK